MSFGKKITGQNKESMMKDYLRKKYGYWKGETAVKFVNSIGAFCLLSRGREDTQTRAEM